MFLRAAIGVCIGLCAVREPGLTVVAVSGIPLSACGDRFIVVLICKISNITQDKSASTTNGKTQQLQHPATAAANTQQLQRDKVNHLRCWRNPAASAALHPFPHQNSSYRTPKARS
jgi:hypothetical protein